MTHTTYAERGTLADLTAYRAEESARAGSGPRAAHDLSSNELALPPLPSVLAGVQSELPRLGRYPDPTARELTEAVAGHLRVAPDQVAVGPGSAGVLQQILLALCGPGDEVVYAWPGFDAYPLLVAVAGATSVTVPLTGSGHHDLDALAARVTGRTKVVILCSPHNPTGTVIERERLHAFLRSLPEHVVTVLDEAYVEFERCGDPPGLPDVLRPAGRTVVLRTFSKAYGLAGLRVGYAAGPREVMATVRKTAIPFGVTRLAEHAAILSLGNGAELRGRLASVAAARSELALRLRELGLPVLPSQANFLWLPIPSHAASFGRAAAAAGVRVRAVQGQGVRVSVGAPEAHDMLLAALGQWARGMRF
ncbi:histidinol-phosphate transaminase [Streptomyces sp. NPDC089919]|uniref:histidinol-phosphate transaminase n=1 Tax=Streptomyces sp. NPDC089919 TaxID=3155188 RepID=UPI00341FC9C9